MNVSRLIVVCVFILVAFCRASLVQGVASCNECCQQGNYKDISDSRRSTQSVWEPGQTPLCDHTLEKGWYRFTSFVGGKMPTSMVTQNRCGTKAPIWLNGVHPAPNVVKLVQACVNIFDRRGGCFYSFGVTVKNCNGQYFVYYLQPTYSCYIAYCAGNGKPCPYGQTGTSLNTCSATPVKFPGNTYLGRPNISYVDMADPDTDRVKLYCEVPLLKGIELWKNVTYRIQWYSEGKLIEAAAPFCLPRSGQLENDESCPGSGRKEIRSQLSNFEPGQRISCNVSARFTNVNPSSWSDPMHITQPFFAGIQVYPTTLIIKECDTPKTITLTPTIPVRKNSKGFYLFVKFFLPPGLWIMGEKNCHIEMKETNSVAVQIGATCNTLRGSKKLNVITPRFTNHNDSDFWGFFGLPTIWITVQQKGTEMRKCRSVTDPHYLMMDPRVGWRDFMGHGDFTLYSNTEKNFELYLTLKELVSRLEICTFLNGDTPVKWRVVEVQTRQWACNNANSVTCNCGVILRDHNDLIKFSCCNPSFTRDDSTPIEVTIPRSKCLAPGISLKQLIKGFNSKYEVVFPTGIKVELERNYWGIDVTIYAPLAENRANEDGLCNYSTTNGDINTFGNSQRKFPSYFHKLPDTINQNSDEVTFEKACACSEEIDQGRTADCHDGIPVFFPGPPTKQRLNRILMCNRNVKRDITNSDDLTEEDFELFRKLDYPELHKRQKRSITQISKENATRYCKEKLADTTVGKLCAKLGTNIQALVNVCSADIEYTGDISFAIGAVSLLLSECYDEAVRNMTFNATGMAEVEMPTIVNEIANIMCPNDCAFNGKCINGSCLCDGGYTADDCSISLYQKPSIKRLQTDGLCDRRQRACKRATVLGTQFLNSTNLTCHISEFQIWNSSWVPNDAEVKYPAMMTDLVLVECFLPDSPVMTRQYDENVQGTPAAGLMVSVSNNGFSQSDQKLKFISYDSVCLEFNHPPHFTPKTDYYALYGETLELLIGVSDPEGMPVTISSLEGTPKEARIQNNILFWNVTTNKTTPFYFEATDSCQASSTLNITITINVCPCKNKGVCVPQMPRGSGVYTCDCAGGYAGQYCETEIDECRSYPCLRGQCIDGINNYSCICDDGFDGRNCDNDINYCQSSPCIHGTCLDLVNNYSCICAAGFTGLHCDTPITRCNNNSCYPGAQCTENVLTISCGSCPSGYTGDGKNCKDIDDCHNHTCQNGASCVDGVNDYSCACVQGFTGRSCEANIDDCVNHTCAHGGTCMDGVNSYSCKCAAGFSGHHCQNNKDDCRRNHTCQNGASCVDGINDYSCACVQGFTGQSCETNVDDCHNHTCQNGASCVDGVNDYLCTCVLGFTGQSCETKALRTALLSWKVGRDKPLKENRAPHPSELQKKLSQHVDSINKDSNLYVPADKTTNFYKMNANDYKSLLNKNIEKEYKKSPANAETHINTEAKDLAQTLKIDDRVEMLAPKESFITLKDHKDNFQNNPKCRLINPTKSELGKVSKQTLDKINKAVIDKTNVHQWKNTRATLDWFINIPNKDQQSFIAFDIVNFYPSISYKLLSDALSFAASYTDISAEDRRIIFHTKQSLLFNDNTPWPMEQKAFNNFI
ncbi:Fibropellin-1 [Stylophora pistillata]|uniref:Fibropellin-1 n=1 Tax=Stylophora pistillata TaxID=50429 RepID=A0A2B4RJY5_STYPI|nr:Fibropellin-1 [Stylophora pistillata]